jgi:hypothetical protein
VIKVCNVKCDEGEGEEQCSEVKKKKSKAKKVGEEWRAEALNRKGIENIQKKLSDPINILKSFQLKQGPDCVVVSKGQCLTCATCNDGLSLLGHWLRHLHAIHRGWPMQFGV